MDQTMTKRTPGPYTADIPRDFSGEIICFIDDANGKDIGRTRGVDEEQVKADAEFIVRACNAHDDLIEVRNLASVLRAFQREYLADIENKDKGGAVAFAASLLDVALERVEELDV